MIVPYEGHSAGFQHCAVHPLGWCLRRLLRGYESLSANGAIKDVLGIVGTFLIHDTIRSTRPV
jgi:hypothetical protein